MTLFRIYPLGNKKKYHSFSKPSQTYKTPFSLSLSPPIPELSGRLISCCTEHWLCSVHSTPLHSTVVEIRNIQNYIPIDKLSSYNSCLHTSLTPSHTHTFSSLLIAETLLKLCCYFFHPCSWNVSHLTLSHKSNFQSDLSDAVSQPGLASSYLNTLFTLESADIEINRCESRGHISFEKNFRLNCLRDAGV